MTFLWILLILALFYLLAQVAAIFVSLRPYRIPIFHSPGMLGAPQEDVEFKAHDGVTIRGWWCQSDQPDKGVVVLAHGYFMNRSEPAALAHFFWTLGYSCLIFDFPGAGRSDNRKCGFGWVERLDVHAAIQFARTRQLGGNMILWGSSMGAAACAFAAADEPSLVGCLILDSVYGRLLDAVSGWWLFVGGRWLSVFLAPTRLIAPAFVSFHPQKADVAVALTKLADKPVLLLHGECDTMATPAQANRNAQALGPQGAIEWFAGCQHSEPRLFHPVRYRNLIEAFLKNQCG